MIVADTLDAAVAALRDGGVIAYPTEGVWGLGCDPDNDAAVAQLLRLKQRDPAKGLILIAASIEQFAPWLEGLPPELHAPLVASWPGPNTWLVPDNGRTHALVRGAHECVALRVSDHQGVIALCQAFGGPIVSTSANKALSSVASPGAGMIPSRFLKIIDRLRWARLPKLLASSALQRLTMASAL